MVSSNAAQIMGMYRRKGALAVGSDADIVVPDTGIKETLRAADLHETDYSPWEGHVMTACPSVTVPRGKDGQFLPREVTDEIRQPRLYERILLRAQ
jgi:dihydropyrimidinase